MDDTRYLLGYREGSSAQPYRYRLLVRAGDAYSFGPAVVRPPPTAFGALASNESQTDPALFRVGPTTFVEARPGYVQLPGNLGSWTLEVLPDDSLTATAPTVHATVTQTMIPEVAADGSGRALIAYHTYLDEDWQYGLYTHSGRELMVRGILASSADVSIRTHQGESTDRYLGGAYYLQLPGSASTDAPLLRVDASDGSVTRLPDVPSLYYCSRVPQMVRAGTVAAYAACDHVHFVDLLPRCGNGVVEVPETCDDANNSDGDGCSAGCTS